MKKLLLPILWLMAQGQVLGQSAQPGGVAKPSIWYLTAATNEGISWVDQAKTLTVPRFFIKAKQPLALTNFNQGFPFAEGNQKLVLPISGIKLNQSTIFTVYHPIDSSTERSVWHLEQSHQSSLILTTHRMADLDLPSYLNFLDQRKDLPGINTFIQRQEDEGHQEQELFFGQKPTLPDLPIAHFSGSLPELIIYDRVLSPFERLKIESYLGIKYGITLQQTTTPYYLNAKGESIWDGVKNEPYNHNIAGIARDDQSGLLQKQSSSVNQAGFMTLGLDKIQKSNEENQAQIADLSALLWGDNQGKLFFTAPAPGQMLHMQRRWLIEAHGTSTALSTALKFDTRFFETSLKPDQLFWLVLDRSGTGNFPLEEVEYFPMNDLDANGYVTFFGIHWDSDHSGSDVFTLGIGPKLSVVHRITAPSCVEQESGQITIKVIGGTAPYLAELVRNNDQQKFSRQLSHTTFSEWKDLKPGIYQLTLTDAQGQKYRTEIHVNSKEAPTHNLQNQYTLKIGQSLGLSPRSKQGMDAIHYQWQAPDGTLSYAPNLDVQIPGRYSLSIDSAGCISNHEFWVSQPKADNFEEILLFPNPLTKGEAFFLRIQLHETAEVLVTLRDITGKLIRRDKLSPSHSFLYRKSITTAGAYVLELESNQTKRSITLVVN